MWMDIKDANICWFIFWLTYWAVGCPVSYYSNNKRIRKITNVFKVAKNITCNMIWTLIATNIINIFSYDGFRDYPVFFKLVMCFLIVEIWFYHIHYLLHNKLFYSTFHKTHHTFAEPYALTAMYCSPFEAVFCNLIAVTLGPLLMSLSTPWVYIWFGFTAFNTIMSHSGLKYSIKVPFKKIEVHLIDGAHDLHHKNFIYNYGTLPIFDILYGTYKEKM